jgi:cytochrome c peroxidase
MKKLIFKIGFITAVILASVGLYFNFEATNSNENITNRTPLNNNNFIQVQTDNKSVEKDELIQKALERNLKAVPTDKNELYSIIDNKNNKLTPEKIELGKKLYFEARISKSGLISCNTCHNLATAGVDGVSAAIGHKWTANPHHLNSPTVYNAVFASKQFWDGRSPDLENQAQGPILASPEMASTKEHVVKVVTSMPEYVQEFKTAYGDEVQINYELITATIGLFERTLVTTSKYDDYLNGNSSALSQNEKEGLELFIDKGCVSCHNNYALGGTMQMFPAVKPYKYANIGDFTGDANKMVKVPTLRNIEETAPYLHNGAVWTLSEAVQIMGETQLGIDLTQDENSKIVAFLKTLTGEKPEVIYPILPNSTKDTPLPDLN